MNSIFSQFRAIFLPLFLHAPESNSSIGAGIGGKGGSGSVYKYFYYPHAYEKKGKTVPVSPVASRFLNFESIGLRSELRKVQRRMVRSPKFLGSSPAPWTNGAKDREKRVAVGVNQWLMFGFSYRSRFNYVGNFMKKLSQKMLAAALGISGAMVSRLKSRGMPVDSLDAARTWRNQNLNHNLVKDYRISAPDGVARPERVPNEVTSASEIFGGAMGPEIDPVVSPPVTGESYQKRLTESARREAALADIAEMNRDRQRGRLCDVESVRSVLMENYVAIRQQFERVPHELKSVISPEAFQMLSDRIRLALEAVAQAAANSANQIRELDSQQ